MLQIFSRGFKDIIIQTRSFQALKINFKIQGDSRKSRTPGNPDIMYCTAAECSAYFCQQRVGADRTLTGDSVLSSAAVSQRCLPCSPPCEASRLAWESPGRESPGRGVAWEGVFAAGWSPAYIAN